MQTKRRTINHKRVDSYSALICAKYFKTEQDFINLICVNSKFKETTEKFRFNPISIESLKLFPKIQTQHLYKKNDEMLKIEQIIKYEIWYFIDFGEYTQYEECNIKCHNIEFTQTNRKKYKCEIPNNVTFLGDFCFFECSKLSTIELPSSLLSIGNNCFSFCSILSFINLPSSLQSLGNFCFYGCRTLSRIKLPLSLKSLGDGCFYKCSTISKIDLPSSLTSLGNGCFYKCSSLSTINLPSLLTSFNKGCFSGCEHLIGVINVPDYCFEKPW
ncbi:Leucine rich repeat containing protein BspA family protein [Entamoeba marina]